MKARVFHAIQYHLLVLRRGDWRRKLLVETIAEYIVEFVTVADLLSDMQQSDPTQESVENFTSTWIVQIALSEAFEREPKIMFYTESVIHIAQLFSFILITSIVSEKWTGRFVFLTITTVGFLMDAIKLLYLMERTRKQELEDRNLLKSPFYVSIWRAPFAFFGFSTSFRSDKSNWVSIAKLIFVAIEITTQWQLWASSSSPHYKTMTNRENARTISAAFAALLMWVQIVFVLRDTHPKFATFVLMIEQILIQIMYFLLLFVLFLLGFAHW